NAETRIFCVACAVDFEPVRFESRAVRVDDQSLWRMRVRVQVLLRAVYTRIHGIGCVGIREAHLCKTGSVCLFAAGDCTEVFVRIGDGRWGGAGTYCHRDGDGSIPAGRTGVWRYARVFGRTSEERRLEHIDNDQVESGAARFGFAKADCGKVGFVREYDDFY